jgi:hypothetical protein
VALAFSQDRKTVSVSGVSFPLGKGRTVEQTSGGIGNFDPATGAMNIPIAFEGHNLGLPLFQNDATAAFSDPGLTTEDERPLGPFVHNGGSRLDRTNGQILLVGTSMITNNLIIGGTNVELIISGVISPLP